MDWAWVGSALFAALSVVALLLAGLVHRASPAGSAGRAVAQLLVVEALFAAANGYLQIRPDTELDGLAVLLTLFLTFYLMALLYLRVIATLDTPVARWLRVPALVRVWQAAFVLVLFGWIFIEAGTLLGRLELNTTGGVDSGSPAVIAWIAIGLFLVLTTSIFGLAAAISAHRRAIRGSAARRRARAFLLAFGVRDLAFFSTLVVFEIFAEIMPTAVLRDFFASDIDTIGIGLGLIVYILTLAYGMLREHLFDIDLKIKVGISRGTVAGIILVAVFVGAKLVESYLNRTAGVVAGSIVAGSLLFLVPKLNKVGEKVANTAMPQVQPTSGYVQFKKLEVYRAAVEASQETGGIGERERASLDRLRVKLGLDAADCRAVEGEVVFV